MASLTIPARHKPIFKELLKLPSEELGSLLEALRALQPQSLDITHLTEDLAAKSSLSEELAESVLGMLVSMLGIPLVMALDREELAPAILEALARETAFSAEPEQLEEFRPFIEGALSLESSLGLLAKGIHLAASNERRFCGVTILTDLRPIFLGDELESPSALIGSHTLRLSFHKADFELDDVHISLEPKDLEKLSEAVKRAQRKEESLRQVAAKSGVPFLGREDKPC